MAFEACLGFRSKQYAMGRTGPPAPMTVAGIRYEIDRLPIKRAPGAAGSRIIDNARGKAPKPSLEAAFAASLPKSPR
ncbi:hypothetical protein N825_23185 [Skermanella stibiiresistens SB22]|uniref:Uncharacterized protein n=1 Tax=Skermanella stibiiresistens SB22 TaxID=1385369 RepID=W9GZI7_9PROT|nr:hypothetical protein N825_23185 [Skermanella stibiiresistens SB22]